MSALFHPCCAESNAVGMVIRMKRAYGRLLKQLLATTLTFSLILQNTALAMASFIDTDEHTHPGATFGMADVAEDTYQVESEENHPAMRTIDELKQLDAVRLDQNGKVVAVYTGPGSEITDDEVSFLFASDYPASVSHRANSGEVIVDPSMEELNISDDEVAFAIELHGSQMVFQREINALLRAKKNTDLDDTTVADLVTLICSGYTYSQAYAANISADVLGYTLEEICSAKIEALTDTRTIDEYDVETMSSNVQLATRLGLPAAILDDYIELNGKISEEDIYAEYRVARAEKLSVEQSREEIMELPISELEKPIDSASDEEVTFNGTEGSVAQNSTLYPEEEAQEELGQEAEMTEETTEEILEPEESTAPNEVMQTEASIVEDDNKNIEHIPVDMSSTSDTHSGDDMDDIETNADEELYPENKVITDEEVANPVGRLEENEVVENNEWLELTAGMSVQSGDGIPYTPEQVLDDPFAYKSVGQIDANLLSGNFIFTETDLSIPGVNGLDLNIVRQYDYSSSGAHYPAGNYNDAYDNQNTIGLEVEGYVATITGTYYQLVSNLANYTYIGTGQKMPAYIASNVMIYQQGSSIQPIPSVYKGSEYDDAVYFRSYIDQVHVGGWVFGVRDRSGDLYAMRLRPVLVEAGAFEDAYENIPYDYDYTVNEFGLGHGWRLGFSAIENYFSGFNNPIKQRLITSDGRKYNIFFTSTVGDSNLEEYTLTDIRLENTGNGYPGAAYTLFHSDGKKEYFDAKGRNIAIVDRFGNEITLEYTFADTNQRIVSQIRIVDTLNNIVIYKNENIDPDVVLQVPGLSKVRGRYNSKWTLSLNNNVTRTYYSYTNTTAAQGLRARLLQVVDNELSEHAVYQGSVSRFSFNCYATSPATNDAVGVRGFFSSVTYPSGLTVEANASGYAMNQRNVVLGYAGYMGHSRVSGIGYYNETPDEDMFYTKRVQYTVPDLTGYYEYIAPNSDTITKEEVHHICEYPGMWVAQYRIMLACSVATFFSRLQATTVPSNLSRHPRRGIDLSIHSFYGNVEGDAFRIKLCATSIDGILSPALYGKVLEGESYEIRVTLTPDISSLLFSIIYLLFMALLAMVGPDLLGIPFILIITFAIDAFVLIGYAFFYMDARKKGLGLV